MDLVIKNTLAYIDGKFIKTSIGIQNTKYAYIGDQPPKAKQEINGEGLHCIPGAIDSQVHFREPGFDKKENIAQGSRAALLGGITAFFEMPNTKPATINRERIEEKLRIAKRTSYTDYAFYIGATQENIPSLKLLQNQSGICGIKTFMGSSTGSLLLYDKEDLEDLVRSSSTTLAFHCEDEDRMNERIHIAKEAKSCHAHPIWRDEQAALLATKKIVEIAKKLNRRVHILHVSTKEEMAYLKENKKWVSIEVTPQHLSLHAPDCYDELGSLAQMNPPIRGIEHQNALWEAINDGTVDVIGSDHAPHTLEEKARAYPSSPSGMPGVESLLPLMLNHVSEGRLSLERLVELVSIRPLELFSIKNRNPIIINGDATLTLIDMKQTKEFKNHYLCGWSPFEKKVLKAWPVGVILHGQLVMKNQEILHTCLGRELAFGIS